MIFATGGRASGATSTRSRPRSCAAANASSTVSTPSCAPSGAITRIGLIRICRLTRMRGVLLFGFSIARCRSPPRERKSGLRLPGNPLDLTPWPPLRIAEGGVGSQASETLEHSPSGEAAGEAHSRRPLAVFSALSLARQKRVHKCKRFALTPQPTRDHRGIVLEEQQPAFRFRPRIQPAL